MDAANQGPLQGIEREEYPFFWVSPIGGTPIPFHPTLTHGHTRKELGKLLSFASHVGASESEAVEFPEEAVEHLKAVGGKPTNLNNARNGTICHRL